MENQIVSKYFDHPDFSPHVDATVKQICRNYGFDPTETVHKRYIYNPDKLWRVRLRGVWQKLPAMLRIENMRLETDEELIREAFRKQCKGSNVRPPITYVSMPYDKSKGYAFSIEEYVDGSPLFNPAEAAETAWSFVPFYRELRRAVTKPFWPCPEMDARDYSIQKMADWHRIAAKKFPERTNRLDKVLSRLMAHSIDLIDHEPLSFQHSHLTGADVRENEKGEWVVFANHFWRWGQPGYDVAFPMWSMWLSLSPKHRAASDVRHITDLWLTMIRDEFHDLVSPDALVAMVLNRLYGALLVDVPAKMETEPLDEVESLERSLIAESERFISAFDRKIVSFP